jgi:hypothetical protein
MPLDALVTVSVTLVVCVADGPVPVTVMVYVPAGVLALVVTVSVELPPAVTLVGLKLAVDPLGRPLALSEMVCAEPLVTAVLMVLVALPPAVAVTLLGLALIEKSLPAGAPQVEIWKEPMRVAQLNAPDAGSYWLTYQKVQSSVGSTLIEL